MPEKVFFPHGRIRFFPCSRTDKRGAEIESDADYSLFWCYFGLIFIQFDANLALKFKKFGTNSLSNISIKKVPYLMPDKHFLN